MNAVDILLILLLVVALGLAVKETLRRRKKGGCSGCSGCSDCSGCSACSFKEKK